MPKNHNWIPDLTNPRNELLIILAAVAAAIGPIIDLINDADISTPTGIATAIIAIIGLVTRRNTNGPLT